MRTKDLIMLGAGYVAGRLSKKNDAGFIGAVGKKMYLVDYTKGNGRKSTTIVKAQSKKEAIGNAKNLVYTGKDFRNARVTNSETWKGVYDQIYLRKGRK